MIQLQRTPESRFLLSTLQSAGPRLQMNGELFSGVAYRTNGNLVVQEVSVEAGAIAAVTREWPGGQCIAVRSIEEEPVLLAGIPHTGVCMEFDNASGRLRAEREVSRGVLQLRSRGWHTDGTPESDCDDAVVQIWRESGYLGRYRSDVLSFGLNDEGRLSFVWCEDTCETAQLTEILQIGVASKLALAGSGVDNGFVASLRGLDDVQDLTLDETSIDRQGIGELADCSLSQFSFRGNSRLSQSDIASFLATLKDCQTYDLEAMERDAAEIDT